MFRSSVPGLRDPSLTGGYYNPRSDEETEAIMAYHKAKRRAKIEAFVRPDDPKANFVRMFVGKVAGVKPSEGGVIKHQ